MARCLRSSKQGAVDPVQGQPLGHPATREGPQLMPHKACLRADPELCDSGDPLYAGTSPKPDMQSPLVHICWKESGLQAGNPRQNCRQ